MIGGVRVVRFSSLRWRVGVAAIVSLAVAAAVLSVALAAADGARAAGDDLSRRLVPAAAVSGQLLAQYNEQQLALRDYITGGNPAALVPYRHAGAQIPAQQGRLARLIRGYRGAPRGLAGAEAAYRTWLATVAGPQLAAARHSDFTTARALQADIDASRPEALAVRTRVAALQAQITSLQAQATARLINDQHLVLLALIAGCAAVVLIAVGAVAAVRRWLLRPFVSLRRAAEAVAAGSYGTQVPAVGPAELDELARATEAMRKRLVAALAEAEQAEQRFRALFESSPDATLTVTADLSVIMANAQAERVFGYSVGELVGQPISKLIPAAVDVPDSYLADLGPQPLNGCPVIAMDKRGTEFPAESSVTALPTESGLVGLISVRDIRERVAAQAEAEQLRAEAERERYEARLAQSQRLESLGQLVGGVAHDFNNLLNVIRGYSDFVAEGIGVLASQDGELEAVLADVGEIRAAAQRAVNLTRQLLIFARRDAISPRVLDVGGVITDIENLLRRTLGEHIKLLISVAPGLWPVLADPGQIEQVLVNLAVNARDAMSGGGKLTIEAGNITADLAYAAARPGLAPGSYTQIRVSDSGTGMDKEVLAKVFEPFYTTKPKGQGTGLGLATVYGIITQLGGCVQIYSEPGLGTTASVLLPATDAEPAAIESKAAAPEHGRGETVLLMEDEQSLRDLAIRILARNGYQVLVAATPADALRQTSDPAQPVDLLLTDVVMPRMLGHEIAALIRATRPGLPVLFMSGYTQPILDTHGAIDDATDLLEKPFTESALLARVRNAIDNRGASGAAVIRVIAE